MSEVNKNQRDFWSGKGGDIWVERQNAMDTMLSPLGEAALNKLNLNAIRRTFSTLAVGAEIQLLI